MDMHDGAVRRVPPVEAHVQRCLLGRLRPARDRPVEVEDREVALGERAEGGAGAGDQDPLPVDRGDVPGGAGAEPGIDQGASRGDQLIDHAHPRTSHAVVNMSSPPKFPLFSASATGLPPEEASDQHTPGAISGPILSAVAPSAPTTAPLDSPPATISAEERPEPTS